MRKQQHNWNVIKTPDYSATIQKNYCELNRFQTLKGYLHHPKSTELFHGVIPQPLPNCGFNE